MDGYNTLITLNRPNEDGGGGVALYVSKSYNFKILDNLSYNSNDSQFLLAKIEKNNNSIIVGVTYKPPNTSIDSYSNTFKELLDNFESNTTSCFIAGDFNIDLLKSENHQETNSFFNSLLTYSFFPTIVKPTRITSHSATLIDNIYLNTFDTIDNTQSGILYTDISDHLPVFVVQYGVSQNRKRYIKIEKRISSAQSVEHFRHDLSSHDWSSIYKSNDPNEQYSYLSDVLENLHNKHFPIKTIKINNKTKQNAWITPGILKSIKRKNKLYRIKIKNPTASNINKFCQYRNRLNHLIRFTKKTYYKSMLEKAEGNIKATWNIINEILNNKKAHSKNVDYILSNGKRHRKKTEIANLFNKFFTGIGPSLASHVQSSQRNYKEWMKLSSPNDLSFSPISPFKVLDEIHGLDSTKAAGHEGIPKRRIISVAESIYQPLCHIFNTSLLTCTFSRQNENCKSYSVVQGRW